MPRGDPDDPPTCAGLPQASPDDDDDGDTWRSRRRTADIGDGGPHAFSPQPPSGAGGGMSTRQRVRLVLEGLMPWATVLIAPLCINMLVWQGLVRHQQHALEAWQETRSATVIKPQLQTLLAQSQQVLAQWRQTSFSQSDPSAVMQTIQRLAGVYHVQVKELNTTSVHASGAGGTMPMELEVLGSFDKLARWMSDVESQAGLQMDSWTLTQGHEAGEPHRLTVHMTALLQGAA